MMPHEDIETLEATIRRWESFVQHGQEVLRSLEAAAGSMKEATLQHPGTAAKATSPAKKKAPARKKTRKRRQQPKRGRSYELALELLSSSSEPMTASEIQRSLSKQGQEFAHQTIVYGLEKLVDAGKAKRRKAKGRVRYRAIPEEPAAEESAKS